MLSNTISCCRKCFNPNELFYVQVENNYTRYVYIHLKYKLDTKLIEKQSPVFKPGTLQRLTFPLGASEIFLRIYDISRVPPITIWIQSILNDTTECFKVTGHSILTVDCVEVPC